MPEIYLALIEKATAKQRIDYGNGRKARDVSIHIPRDPEIINYDRKQSPWFWLECVEHLRSNGYAKIASHENPLVTPSSGAISFFYDPKGEIRYVAMAQKDAGAPRDPGFRVPRNGFPQSEQDWYTMDHLVREAFEEGIMLTRNYELVLPVDGTGEDEINQRAEILVTQTPIKINGTRRVPIVFRDGRDTLRVYREGEKQPRYEGKGAISFTPETGFNFIKMMEVQYPIDELYLIDSETKPDGSIIGREYCVIDLAHLTRKRFGEPIHETVHTIREGEKLLSNVSVYERDDKFETDKVPRSLLCQIKYDGQLVYPIDWMDESYEFLSNPRVLQAFNRAFAFSAFEKQLKLRN